MFCWHAEHIGQNVSDKEESTHRLSGLPSYLVGSEIYDLEHSPLSTHTFMVAAIFLFSLATALLDADIMHTAVDHLSIHPSITTNAEYYPRQHHLRSQAWHLCPQMSGWSQCVLLTFASSLQSWSAMSSHTLWWWEPACLTVHSPVQLACRSINCLFHLWPVPYAGLHIWRADSIPDHVHSSYIH